MESKILKWKYRNGIAKYNINSMDKGENGECGKRIQMTNIIFYESNEIYCTLWLKNRK